MDNQENCKQEGWSIDKANRLYNIDRWGIGYFSINDKGNVIVSPNQDENSIPILDIVNEAKSMGLQFPLKIRLQDLLRHRIISLNKAFYNAIDEYNYKSKYMGVFPIKVNQFYEVVEEILDAGKDYNYGIEAGSKPELLTALSMHDNYESLVICNGYKDANFIKHALNGRKLGKKVLIVAEKLEEVKLIIEVSKEMNIEPMIGLRIRLATKSAGKWSHSSGENAKFGLSSFDIVEAVKMLKQAQLLNSLKMIHFHIGSQIPDIRVIGKAVKEGTRYYAKLIKMGCNLEYIDIGGGLGVDYDGSKSTFSSSINYTLQEYANNVVYHVKDICDEEKVNHPIIITESGRAVVSHHSLLVVESFGKIQKNKYLPEIEMENVHKIVKSMFDIKSNVYKTPMLELFHDLQFEKEQAQGLFQYGMLDIESKAIVESLYWEIIDMILKSYQRVEDMPDEIKEFNHTLSEQYLLNFSVFQSLPDYWAVGQLFPIVPIHKLNEQPKFSATLVDITCDSDGKITQFVDLADVKPSIYLHDVKGDEPYYIGFFLTGAYQDVMGDLHNLFGKINEVHVYIDPDEEQGWYIKDTVKGDKISDVLKMNQYSITDVLKRVKKQVDYAIKTDKLKPNEGMRILAEFEKGLSDYTYLVRK